MRKEAHRASEAILMMGTIPLATRRPAYGGAYHFDDRKVARHVDIS
jgi:hypothetical protein